MTLLIINVQIVKNITSFQMNNEAKEYIHILATKMDKIRHDGVFEEDGKKYSKLTLEEDIPALRLKKGAFIALCQAAFNYLINCIEDNIHKELKKFGFTGGRSDDAVTPCKT